MVYLYLYIFVFMKGEIKREEVKLLKCSESIHTEFKVFCAKKKDTITRQTDEALIFYMEANGHSIKRDKKGR
jgi:hypothetical protein